MFLVVGLGNPGRQYEANRHNLGFMVADELRRAAGLVDFRDKFSGVWTKGSIAGEEVALLKPMTFMNLSGESVQPACAFFKVTPAELVVVHDEIDLPWKEIRVKVGGGHAGHNGLRSLVQRLGTAEFVRVRVGVGRPPPGFRGDVADFVLQDFDPLERAELPDVVARAADAVRLVLRDGTSAAMKALHTKAPPRPKKPDPA